MLASTCIELRCIRIVKGDAFAISAQINAVFRACASSGSAGQAAHAGIGAISPPSGRPPDLEIRVVRRREKTSMGTRGRKVVVALSALALTAALGLGNSIARADSNSDTVSQTQSTTSYTVQLDIGPVETIMTPEQGANAKTGDVLSAAPETTHDTIIDDRLPVNHSFELHIMNKATGAPITGTKVEVMLKDWANGRTYLPDDMVRMYDVDQGVKDMHYGRNIYLPAGHYTLDLMVGQERVSFHDVIVP
jgi:hypothetical protein